MKAQTFGAAAGLAALLVVSVEARKARTPAWD
jgi:hypothetical protein